MGDADDPDQGAEEFQGEALGIQAPEEDGALLESRKELSELCFGNRLVRRGVAGRGVSEREFLDRLGLLGIAGGPVCGPTGAGAAAGGERRG